MQLATYVRTIIMDTIILMTLLYTFLSCPSSMSCLFYSWTLAILCVFLFLLNAWAFVLEFVLVFMSWGKDCADVQVYRTITLFLFLFFHLFQKKRKRKALVGFYFYSCLSFTFFHFVHKEPPKKAWKQVLKLLDFLNSECTNF
jgi:hypothetical protein